MLVLYLDADGVICGFAEAVQKLGIVPTLGLSDNSNPVLKQHMYDRIEEAGEEFWSSMPWTPEGKRLWNYFRPYCPTILTSPGKFRYCKAGRTKWFAENLPGVPVFFEENKYLYSGRDKILIDDMIDNIEPWRAKGGIGILHKNFEQTKQEFEKIMSQPIMQVSLASHLRALAKGFQ